MQRGIHRGGSVPYLVLQDVLDVALLLAGDEAVEQHRETADEGLRDGAGPRLSDDDVTSVHPFLHVAHEPLQPRSAILGLLDICTLRLGSLPGLLI